MNNKNRSGQDEIQPIDFSKPVQIADKIFWVGIYLVNDPFQCHPYLIENGNDSILIDPGSVIQKEKIIDKIRQVCDLSSIKYIILNHQDPDLCAAVPELERLINRKDLTIVTHSRMSILIKHYGLQSGYYNIDHHDFVLKAGDLTLEFLTTPYCHSPGAAVTYDRARKILFSGDLFGGLEESWQFYADEKYFSYIEGFHMSYMPSRDILNYSLRKIESLDIDLIAPQHGSLIKKEYIHDLIQQMKRMESGLYIDKEYSENLTNTIHQLNNLKNDLQISFDEVNELKKQQDGDYFLMNLLAGPLTKNNNKSEITNVGFIVYQKKRFRFRNKVSEIGGDFCYSENLVFQGENHTMFFNGDSMGKSMQGAGGLLVIGTALTSIINRSRGMNLTISSNDWLIGTYLELQRLFLSFDESMMISCVIGCINDSTGKMSYLNAEHPYVILFRDGKSMFLDTETSLRKIGCRGEMEPVVKEFILQKGDLVFIGSDGKDDLKIIFDDDNYVMNDDPELFRKIVEKASGDMKEIISGLIEAGELTDDLSIMRIGYREESGESMCNCEKILNQLDHERFKKMLHKKRYQEALEIINTLPENSVHTLYLRGLCHYHQNRYIKARSDIASALQVNPDHYSSLKLMGNIDLKFKNFDAAAVHWEHALELNPDDKILYQKYNKVLKRISQQKVLLGVRQGQK